MNAPLPQVAGRYRLEVGDLASVPVSVARAPHISLVQWMLYAATPRTHRSRFASAIAASARPGSRAAYAALGMPGLDRMPDCIAPDFSQYDSTVDEQLARLHDASEDHLAEQITELWSNCPPAPWRPARDHPRAWLDSLVQASRDAWAVAESRWRGGQPALDAEIGRIGTAAVTGSMDVLLNTLHPRVRFSAGCLEITNSCTHSFAIGDRRLVLAPMLSPADRIVVSFEGADIVYIAYPAMGQLDRHGVWRRRSATERLAAVLGPLRAAVLDGLTQARTMSDLARHLQCAPSTATYHCDQLEAAGLIARERRGQSMWVTRTPRAERLLDSLLS